MNLENSYKKIIDELFNGEKSIAIFVIKEKHYYVIDDKINFCIDVRLDYQNYIKQGIMDESLYDEALKQFRGGIPILTENNFHKYIEKNNVEVYSSKWMQKFFVSGRSKSQLIDFYNYIERFLAILSTPVSDEWDNWRLRLPTFYINFNKKIFRHTDWDQMHESSAPKDWDIQANNNFGLLVPDSEQYWLVDNMNFWKLKM